MLMPKGMTYLVCSDCGERYGPVGTLLEVRDAPRCRCGADMWRVASSETLAGAGGRPGGGTDVDKEVD